MMMRWSRYNWSPFSDATINARQRTNVRLHLLTLILWPKTTKNKTLKNERRDVSRPSKTQLSQATYVCLVWYLYGLTFLHNVFISISHSVTVCGSAPRVRSTHEQGVMSVARDTDRLHLLLCEQLIVAAVSWPHTLHAPWRQFHAFVCALQLAARGKTTQLARTNRSIEMSSIFNVYCS